MAGTKAGGIAAAKKNVELYGPDFYRNIGRKGGKMSRNGGFASPQPCDCDVVSGHHMKQQCAGTKGGAISRRGKSAKRR